MPPTHMAPQSTSGSSVLITAHGRVAARRTGEMSRRELEQAIADLLDR